MIVFYGKKDDMCIRIANGVAENVVVDGDRAYYESTLIFVGMKDVAYTDMPEQEIHDYGGELPTLKPFSKLKTGIPMEVRLSKLEKDVKNIKIKVA